MGDVQVTAEPCSLVQSAERSPDAIDHHIRDIDEIDKGPILTARMSLNRSLDQQIGV